MCVHPFYMVVYKSTDWVRKHSFNLSLQYKWNLRTENGVVFLYEIWVCVTLDLQNVPLNMKIWYH